MANQRSIEPITEGIRNKTLTSIGGRLRYNGFSQRGIETTLLRANSEQCQPPLPIAEVKAVAKSVARYKPGPNGGRKLRPPAVVESARRTLTELIQFAANHDWKRGNSYGSMQCLGLLALCGIAHECGSTRVQVSDRQWAERAGMNRRTIRKLRLDLMAAGVLEVFERARVPKATHEAAAATVYRLKMPPTGLRQQDANRTRKVGEVVLLGHSCRSLNADAWRNRTGLGKSAQRVLQGLLMQPQRTCDLTRRLHMVRRTVERALERLESAGLACQTQSGWVLTDTRVEDVSAMLPSHGALERQKRQHRIDRENFERTRAALAAKRPRPSQAPKPESVDSMLTESPLRHAACFRSYSGEARTGESVGRAAAPRRASSSEARELEAEIQNRKALLRSQAEQIMAEARAREGR